MHNQYATAQIFTQQAYKARFNKSRVSDKRRGLWSIVRIRWFTVSAAGLACYLLLCAYVRKNSCHTQVLRFFVFAIHYQFVEIVLLTCSHRDISMEQTIDHTDCWLATIRTGQGQATSSYSIFNLVVWRKWWRNFFFTFYKHRRKQIAAVILKPIIEVTSSTRYFYKKFSVVRQLWSCEFRIFRT